MAKKANKTLTGALPQSAGFPGGKMASSKPNFIEDESYYTTQSEMAEQSQPKPTVKRKGYIFWEQN